MTTDSSFAQRLRAGELLIGTMITLPSPEITEILTQTGYDWLFIDAEHGAFNPQQTQSMLQAAGNCPLRDTGTIRRGYLDQEGTG